MVSLWYGLREALAVAADEGLEAMWARHLAAHRRLWAGLRALGLEPFVENDGERRASFLLACRRFCCLAPRAFAEKGGKWRTFLSKRQSSQLPFSPKHTHARAQ